MKNIIKYSAIILFSVLLAKCDLYPDWEKNIEYADTYPVSGEYYVRDFDFDADTLLEDWYQLYIYNKSYNPTGDSVWVDNASGHPVGGTNDYTYKFKIKTKIDKDKLSFNCVKNGNITGTNLNPADDAISITIENSKVWDWSEDITDPTPDSIYFEFTYYKSDGSILKKIKTYGHRKTGWEFPNYDDDM